jgi:hypothetical protein
MVKRPVVILVKRPVRICVRVHACVRVLCACVCVCVCVRVRVVRGRKSCSRAHMRRHPGHRAVRRGAAAALRPQLPLGLQLRHVPLPRLESAARAGSVGSGPSEVDPSRWAGDKSGGEESNRCSRVALMMGGWAGKRCGKGRQMGKTSSEGYGRRG